MWREALGLENGAQKFGSVSITFPLCTIIPHMTNCYLYEILGLMQQHSLKEAIDRFFALSYHYEVNLDCTV